MSYQKPLLRALQCKLTHCSELIRVYNYIDISNYIFSIVSKPVARYHKHFDTGISILSPVPKHKYCAAIKIDGHAVLFADAPGHLQHLS